MTPSPHSAAGSGSLSFAADRGAGTLVNTAAGPAPSRKPPMIGETGKLRVADDAYMTPEWVWQVLADHVPLRNQIWEPACGTGNGVRVLRAAGFSVRGTDINNYLCHMHGVGDFLDQKPEMAARYHRTIATNPPYSLQDQFIAHALELMRPVAGMVCMLLNHQADTAACRNQFFRDCPAFAGKLTLTKRIAWFGGSGARKNHAWYVWDFAYETRLSNASMGFAP